MRTLHRLLAILTVLAIVAGTLGRVGVAWTCEGRVCSAGSLRCCCASVGESRHGDCAGAESQSSIKNCEGGCGCQAVFTASESSTGVHHAGFAASIHEAPAILTPTLVSQAFVAIESPQVRPLPPPGSCKEAILTKHAGLRAPPAPLV